MLIQIYRYKRYRFDSNTPLFQLEIMRTVPLILNILVGIGKLNRKCKFKNSLKHLKSKTHNRIDHYKFLNRNCFSSFQEHAFLIFLVCNYLSIYIFYLYICFYFACEYPHQFLFIYFIYIFVFILHVNIHISFYLYILSIYLFLFCL